MQSHPPSTQDAPFLQVPQEEKYGLPQQYQVNPSAVWTWSDIVEVSADAVEFSCADAVERRSDATKRAATKTSARRFSFVVLVIVIFLFVFVGFARVAFAFWGCAPRCVQKLTVLTHARPRINGRVDALFSTKSRHG